MSAITLTEQSAPSTPASATVITYPKSDGVMYAKDDVGTERALVNPIVQGTAQATTSGATIPFTGLPVGIQRITVNLVTVSLTGTDHILVQLGTSSGFETTSYVSGCGVVNAAPGIVTSTAGFIIFSGTASRQDSGSLILTRQSGNVWCATGSVYPTDGAGVFVTSGLKSLAGTLDRIRLAATGSDTFDLGSVNILYEYP